MKILVQTMRTSENFKEEEGETTNKLVLDSEKLRRKIQNTKIITIRTNNERRNSDQASLEFHTGFGEFKVGFRLTKFGLVHKNSGLRSRLPPHFNTRATHWPGQINKKNYANFSKSTLYKKISKSNLHKNFLSPIYMFIIYIFFEAHIPRQL